MNYGLLFFQFLPLFIYLLVDYFKGFKAGICAAIASAVLMLGFSYLTFGEVDRISLGEAGLIVVLGLISLKMNNERFFKFQPTVLGLVLGGLFIVFQLRGEPLLVSYLPQMQRLMASGDTTDPQVQAMIRMFQSPEMKTMMARLSRLLGLVFLGHALLMAYAAMHWSTSKWFAWRLAIYPAMFGAMIFVQLTV